MAEPNNALLRSPSFPWNCGDLIHSAAPSPGDSAVSEEGRGKVLESIRAAKVGGDCWEGRAVDIAPVIVCTDGSDFEESLLGASQHIAADGMLIVRTPPGSGESTIVTGARDPMATAEAIDPWSAIDRNTRIFAAPQHEWAAIARIIDSEVIGVDSALLDDQVDRRLFKGLAYRNCFTGQPADIADAITILAEWRRVQDRTRPIAVMTGIAKWKREALERMLWLGRCTFPPSVTTAAEAIALAKTKGGGIAVWPSRMPEGLTEQAAAAGIPLIAVEDGFIRSIGLGAGMHPPSSIIVDGRGIYYDPRRPSDLEHFLETHPFPPALLARAAALRETIVHYGISKYAADPDAPIPPRTTDKRIVLVPGQVEDDQSVLTGGGGVAGNFDLLKRARTLEPDAYILFKPHPDVDAGFRVGKVSDAELLKYADAIVRDEGMATLLKRVDAVHVLTSLTGFEALLRGLDVTTHGRPFYAGWGLTRDMAGPIARRTRRLTLDQLVAGTLLLYPIYLDPVTQLPCPAEVLLDRLHAMKAPKQTVLTRLRALQGRLAKLIGTTTD